MKYFCLSQNSPKLEKRGYGVHPLITQDNPGWLRLKGQLEKLPVALSLADMTTKDHPLVLVNTKFEEMTGYGPDLVGQNCRFLQDDLDNSEARAEIRLALEEARKTQVFLHNRRANGEAFYNLLFIEVFCFRSGKPIVALGAQFDLGPEHPDHKASQDQNTLNDPLFILKSRSEMLRFEKDRIIATTASKLVRSCVVLSDLG